MSQLLDDIAFDGNQGLKPTPAKIRVVDTSADCAHQETINNQQSSTTEDDHNVLLGRLALQSGDLSRDQVENALESWMTDAAHQDFVTFLMVKNYLAPKALGKLVKARDEYLQEQKPGPKSTPPTATVTPQTQTPPAKNGSSLKQSTIPQERGIPAENTIRPLSQPAKAVVVQETEVESTPSEGADLLRYSPGASLQDLLKQTIEMNASDLHVHSEASLRVRLHGEIREATSAVLSADDCERLIRDVLSESELRRLEEKFQVDFACEIPAVGRFRANAYRQQRGLDAVFRTIKPRPPTLKELGLPEDLERYTQFHQGLVLFTGPTGCGKSSTMAAMVELVNQHRPDHILTIEDPIEYVYDSASCNVNQREVGAHTESFSKALRAALREDPDVIVIGELRDFETISLALTAAETGHLVMGSLHTSNAISTLNRLLGVFPPDQQDQVRIMLSESLKVVISQRLVQRADGRGRVPALEVMVNNRAIGNLVRENRTFQIKTLMQTGSAQGQLLLDASLETLLRKRIISEKEAIRHAEEPENFR